MTPQMGQYDETIRQMMRNIQRIEEEQKRLAAQTRLFNILNVNTPSQITSNQDNYDPGDYDYLRLTSDASRNISGFSGGVNGRVLYLMNGGTQNIVLLHNSGLSVAGNGIRCPGAASYTMTPNTTGTKTRVILVYMVDPSGGFWNVFAGSAP